jgi:hypothetical protein
LASKLQAADHQIEELKILHTDAIQRAERKKGKGSALKANISDKDAIISELTSKLAEAPDVTKFENKVTMYKNMVAN